MPNPAFPTLVSRTQDARFYGVEHEDPAVRNDMEGGYVTSRPRFTRKPRRTWKSGFSGISNVDRLTLETFWDTVKGGSLLFDWTNPQDLVVYAVRFNGGLQFTYVGAGATVRWDVQFTVEEA